jgi:hypothetical protein
MNYEPDIWVAEYNPKQKQFHIEMASRNFMRNLRKIRNSGKNRQDWSIIFIGTYDDCSEACNILENNLKIKKHI